MKNHIIEQVKQAIREHFAWPGGYPIFTTMSDGELLCPDCAKENFRLIVDSTKHKSRDGWQAIGAGIYWEGPDEQCAHCGKPLASAYGDPDQE